MEGSILDLSKLIFSMNAIRYFIVAAPAFLIFYILFGKKWQFKKIQKSWPKSKDYQREVFYSILTLFIFTGIALIVFGSPLRHYTLQYHDFNEYGWAYWWLSVFFMILLHDTYFYWTHRLMHHPRLFRYFHLVHHKSTNPSPWAAYAFHPLEGIVEAAVIFPIAFIIPFHQTAVIAFLFFMIVYNVYGHLGYELYPRGFNKHFIGKWLNTSVNHNQHHKHFNGNYGLYFLFWDRLMGTIREDYDDAYLTVDQNRDKKSG